jgi:membrane protease YdiL (CAAX protease family)
MRALGIVFLQVLLAVLVSGLVLPALLFAVPQARQVGVLAMVLLVVVLFLLLRVAWPSRRGDG